MEDKKLTGEVAPEQIEAWKKKYGKVQGIVVDGHICYIRKIDRNTVNYALSQLSFTTRKGQALSADEVEVNMGRLFKTGEAVLTNCWIGGSETIRDDVSLYTAACLQAEQLVEFKESSLKNY